MRHRSLHGAVKTELTRQKEYAYHDWNVELLEPVVRDMPKIWKVFDDNMKGCKESCLHALEKMIDSVRDNLQG